MASKTDIKSYKLNHTMWEYLQQTLTVREYHSLMDG